MFLSVVLVLIVSGEVKSYVLSSPAGVWQPGAIPIHIKLGTGTGSLQDGTNFSTSFQAATDAWNAQLGTVQFAATIEPKSSTTDTDGNLNEVIFSDTVEGQAFGSGVLAITLSEYYPSIHEMASADIIVNTAYTWDSYRGAIQSSTLLDLRRVALHELGHVLGLDHPDEHGQNVTAIMNSHISSVDALTGDDVQGAQSIYRAHDDISAPSNDNFSSAVIIALVNNSAQINGSNFYATKQTGEPAHAGSAGGHSVWWKWTAPGNGSMTISTEGSYFDTVLGVYTGTSVSSTTTVAANDEASSTVGYSSVSFSVVGGMTYFIAVDGYAGESGFVSLGLSFTPEVVNTPPAFSVQPSSQIVSVGQTATFGIVASGLPAPSYQWQYLPAGTATWSNLDNVGGYFGCFTTTLTITGVVYNMTGNKLRCVATNSLGSAISGAATLTVNPTVSTVASVVAGGSHALFIKTDGTMLGMGRNNSGQLGDGGTVDRALPVLIASGVAKAAAGANHSLFIRTNGTLWTMGDNSYGQTGAAAIINISYQPTPLQIASNVVLAAGGGEHSLFIKSDGTLWAMGHNNLGQLGDGTTTDRHLPVQIASGVMSVAAGAVHTLFLKTDGTLWAMGGNSAGQLGDGTTTERHAPVQVATGVNSMATGAADSMFVKTNGTLWGAGYNFTGQLGDGSNLQRNTPVQLATSVAFVASGPGQYHMLYVRTDGTLWATGDNSYGELGDGTTTNRYTAEQVASGVASIAAGGSFTLYVRTDGSLWAVGSNLFGQLGKIISTVGVLTQVSGPPSIILQPVSQSVMVGRSVTFVVSASGATAPKLQWRKNGTAISGATGSTFTITSVSLADAGSYTVVATNSDGSTTSAAAVLTVRSLSADFNGDGQSDILWQNIGSGDQGIWIMNGTVPAAWINLPVIALDWRIVGTGDFNSDGQTDILWENVGSGDRGMWIMNGTVPAAWINLPSIALNWRIVGTGDFNGDGMTDILWENVGSGDRGMWIMNGTVPAAWINLPSIALNWRIVGTGDFNGDGMTDILWENVGSGDRGMWIMNATVPAAWINLPSIALNWRIAGTGDFNGDGMTDILWENDSSGDRGMWVMNGTVPAAWINLPSIALNWRIAQ